MKRWIAYFLAVMLLLGAAFPCLGAEIETIAEEKIEEKQLETSAEIEDDMEDVPSISFSEAEEMVPIYIGDEPLYNNAQPEIPQEKKSQLLPNDEYSEEAIHLDTFEPDRDPVVEEVGGNEEVSPLEQISLEFGAQTEDLSGHVETPMIAQLGIDPSPQEEVLQQNPMEGMPMLGKRAPSIRLSCIAEDTGRIWHLYLLPSTESIRIYWEKTQAEKYRILLLDEDDESIMDYVSEASEFWLDPTGYLTSSPYKLIVQALYSDGDIEADSLLFQIDMIEEKDAPADLFMERQEQMQEGFQESAEQIPMVGQMTWPEWSPGPDGQVEEANGENDLPPACYSSQDGFTESNDRNKMMDETVADAENDAQESQSEEKAMDQLSFDDESDTLAELPQVTNHDVNEESSISPETDTVHTISEIIPDDEQDCTQPEENEEYEEGSTFTEGDKDDLASEGMDNTATEAVQDKVSEETIPTDSTENSADSAMEEIDTSNNLPSNEPEEDSQEAYSSEKMDSEEEAPTDDEELSVDTAIAEAETADDSEQETSAENEDTSNTAAASSSSKKTKTASKKSSGKSSSSKKSSAATTASEETFSPALDTFSAEAVTYLSVNGNKLNICLDDGESAYVTELKDSVLCLTPADQANAWTVSLSDVELLRSCGITTLEIVFQDTVYTLALTTEKTAETEESAESIPASMAWRINEEGVILQYGIHLSQWILPEGS